MKDWHRAHSHEHSLEAL
jgi:hypothetical protein